MYVQAVRFDYDKQNSRHCSHFCFIPYCMVVVYFVLVLYCEQHEQSCVPCAWLCGGGLQSQVVTPAYTAPGINDPMLYGAIIVFG